MLDAGTIEPMRGPEPITGREGGLAPAALVLRPTNYIYGLSTMRGSIPYPAGASPPSRPDIAPSPDTNLNILLLALVTGAGAHFHLIFCLGIDLSRAGPFRPEPR